MPDIDFRDHMGERDSQGYFRRFPAGNFMVSVQASQYHYCEPRADLDKYQYTEMEVAIFNTEGWFNVQEELPFEWTALFEPGKIPVAGYVPVPIIQQMIDDLCSIGVYENV